jgi:hypothetical protein
MIASVFVNCCGEIFNGTSKRERDKRKRTLVSINLIFSSKKIATELQLGGHNLFLKAAVL